MRLRNLKKMQCNNDGNRSFYESILNRHVLTALKYLSHNKFNFIILDDLAISFHVRPYACKEITILVKDKSKKIKYFPNNIRNGIKLNVLDPIDINITEEQYKYAINTAYNSDSFKIASPTFLISLYIRELNYDNNDKISRLCSNCPIKKNELFSNNDINNYEKFVQIINMGYSMSNLKNYNDYLKCRIYEGTSGYAEVDKAFKDWIEYTTGVNQILIGGMAVVNYNIEHYTTDADFLFLSNDDVPNFVTGFRKHLKLAFEHIKTNVEIEVLTSSNIGLSQEFVQKVFNTAYDNGKFKIASPSAIVVLKLSRFSAKDQQDIKLIISQYEVNIDIFKEFLSDEEIGRYNNLVD